MKDAKQVFEILVRQHADMLTAYLRAVVREPAVADDLFQETMLVAWRRLDVYDPKRPFGAWLRGIAGRLVLAERRTRAAVVFCDEVVLEQLDHRLGQVEARPGDTFEEKLDGLRKCQEELPDVYREIIGLRYRDGLSPAELVTRLNISWDAQKKRLQRARALLLDCLTRKLAPGEVTP